MKDRSVAGKMYRGGCSGSEIRTGLSLRRGGRWSGSFVCFLCGTSENVMGPFMPGRETRICTFARCFVVEKERVANSGFAAGAGPDRGKLFTGTLVGATGGLKAGPLPSGSRRVSCRSWDHGALDASEARATRLNLLLVREHDKR